MDRRSSVVGQRSDAVQDILERLDAAYGHEHWHWMPEHASPMEIIVGAILVQHTTWQNAERALHAMRDVGLLDANAIIVATDATLVDAVRVSGTPNVKARRLRAIAQTIIGAGGLDATLALPLEDLRILLLATHGVGRETADAIALYACAKRTFVIDAYTRRVFRRVGIGPEHDAHEDWRGFLENALPDAGVRTFQRYHAWIVLHAKTLCRTRPLCDPCPLLDACETGRASTTPHADARPAASVHAGRTAR